MPKHKRSAWIRIAGLGLAEALVVWGITWGIRHEVKAVNQTVSEVSDLRDPSPFRAALLGHLGKIHVGLEGYLRSPDPSMEKQVAESREDFEKLLPEFVRQNPKLFPQVAGEEIKRVFGQFKETIGRTLDANALRMERRAILEQNFTRILYLIDNQIRPLIRKDQADGDERSEAVLNIENQMRAWHDNLALAWAQPSDAAKALVFENDNRGQTFLDLYTNLELLPRERKVLREIRTLWQTNSDLARESFVKESLVGQAEKLMDAEREQVVSTLNKFLPAMPPAELEAKKETILNAMRFHLAGAGAIALLGVASLVIAVIVAYRLLHARAPIADGIYRAPVGPSPDAILQMDLKGMIIGWSTEAETLYGYSSAEMHGQSIGRLFESDSEIARLGKELLKAKRVTFETVHKTKAGAPIPIRIEFHTVTDAAGRASAISLACTRR
jgi:PAS domain S-box-containing protein